MIGNVFYHTQLPIPRQDKWKMSSFKCFDIFPQLIPLI